MTEGSNKNKIFYIIIIILSLIIVYLIVDKVISTNKTNLIISELESSTNAKDSLSSELEYMLDSYENLRTNNDSLNSKLLEEIKRIEELKQEIKKVKYSNKNQIEQYKKEIGTLRNIMKSYIVQIDSLNTLNNNLIAEKQEITNKYNNVVGEKNNLLEEKDSLEQKVDLGAKLKATNIVAIALNRHQKKTTRVNKVERFQICFQISENKLTQTGDKPIFVRIQDPTGQILRNNNSGIFNFGGKEIGYSVKRHINYTGEVQDICIYFKEVPAGLGEGSYTIDIYTDGKYIGMKKFDLN